MEKMPDPRRGGHSTDRRLHPYTSAFVVSGNLDDIAKHVLPPPTIQRGAYSAITQPLVMAQDELPSNCGTLRSGL